MYIGKIIGALVGFRFGYIPGALIGLIAGYFIDRWIAQVGWRGLANPFVRRQQLFGESVTILSAKLAKVDGPVSRAEVDAFKSEFKIPQDQLASVGRIYDQAKQTSDGYEAVAKKLGSTFADAPLLLGGLLDAFRRVAASDGPINAAESEFLNKTAAAFGITGARASASSSDDDPYIILGVARTATTEEIKNAWRELVRQHHPDKLAAKGLAKDYIELATRKMAAINAAWDQIRAERGEA